jgi:hypothetical protein
LWSGLSLYRIITDLGIHRQVSTRSFVTKGFARDYHFTGFPEFDEIHYKVSLITPPYLRQMLYPAELRVHVLIFLTMDKKILFKFIEEGKLFNRVSRNS